MAVLNFGAPAQVCREVHYRPTVRKLLDGRKYRGTRSFPLFNVKNSVFTRRRAGCEVGYVGAEWVTTLSPPSRAGVRASPDGRAYLGPFLIAREKKERRKRKERKEEEKKKRKQIEKAKEKMKKSGSEWSLDT